MRKIAKGNIVYHNLRMNLDNEQHRRIHQVLAKLNTEIHKSVNQFLIDAADFYIRSFQEEGLFKESKKETKYISRQDLENVRRELREEMKNEIIILLGTALTKGTGIIQGIGIGDGQTSGTYESVREEKTENDPVIESLADGWG